MFVQSDLGTERDMCKIRTLLFQNLESLKKLINILIHLMISLLAVH